METIKGDDDEDIRVTRSERDEEVEAKAYEVKRSHYFLFCYSFHFSEEERIACRTQGTGNGKNDGKQRGAIQTIETYPHISKR